jgi:hypothetical protein
MLRLSIRGTFFNNSGSGRTVQIRVKFGGTTIIDKTSSNISTSANPGTFEADIELQADGATNAQHVGGRMTIPIGAAITTGTGSGLVQAGGITTFQGTAAEDSTSDQTLAVTLQLSVSDANLYADIERAILELI